MTKRAQFIAALASQLGSPYVWNTDGGRWNGKDSPRTFDCNGLVCWSLLEVGGPDWRATHTADRMFRELPLVATPVAGDLAFYGPIHHSTHVMVLWGDGRVYGACGGNSDTLAPTPDACVQFRKSTTYRPDLLGFRTLAAYLEVIHQTNRRPEWRGRSSRPAWTSSRRSQQGTAGDLSGFCRHCCRPLSQGRGGQDSRTLDCHSDDRRMFRGARGRRGLGPSSGSRQHDEPERSRVLFGIGHSRHRCGGRSTTNTRRTCRPLPKTAQPARRHRSRSISARRSSYLKTLTSAQTGEANDAGD